MYLKFCNTPCYRCFSAYQNVLRFIRSLIYYDASTLQIKKTLKVRYLYTNWTWLLYTLSKWLHGSGFNHGMFVLGIQYDNEHCVNVQRLTPNHLPHWLTTDRQNPKDQVTRLQHSTPSDYHCSETQLLYWLIGTVALRMECDWIKVAF